MAFRSNRVAFRSNRVAFRSKRMAFRSADYIQTWFTTHFTSIRTLSSGGLTFILKATLFPSCTGCLKLKPRNSSPSKIDDRNRTWNSSVPVIIDDRRSSTSFISRASQISKSPFLSLSSYHCFLFKLENFVGM